MTGPQNPAWARVEELFHAALERPVEQRRAWIDAQAQIPAEVREEARSLLDALDAHQQLSSNRSEDSKQTDGAEPSRLSGRLGPYEIEKPIGAGGMGAVYLAHRADGQFEQQVAIKVMGLHLAGENFLKTFRNERQVLANLRHPNITRLIDGGVAQSGEPYLVMEYIAGETLERYCDSRRLQVEARLRLFLQICSAVEHAHRNLVVHRDLKPANILVDAEGVVKLLDFGTAKLLGDNTSAVTQVGVMTPRYASPEQLRGKPVTTASDVFSLGVILYEMLTGAWPFGNPQSAVDELERLLRRRAATVPSEAITEEAATLRSVSPERLKRAVAGDLSTIVRKMLATEPPERYGSVQQVKEDIERFLGGRPILARPQSAWYSTCKFVSRHWLGVTAAAGSVLALAALTVISVRESTRAREEAERAQRVVEFTKRTFFSASPVWVSPNRGKPGRIEFQDILDSAAERVGKELGNDALAEADLRGTLGQTYSILGEPEKGRQQIELGLKRLHETGNDNSDVAITLLAYLCDARSFQGHFVEALESCQQAVAIARAARSKMPIGSLLHDTAYMAVKAGAPFEEAERLYREALTEVPPEPERARLHPALVNTRIGYLRYMQGDFAEGDRILAGAEQLLRSTPVPPIEIVAVLNAQAFGDRLRGRYEDAAKLLAANLAMLDQRPTPFMTPDLIELQLAASEALAGKPGALDRLRRVEPRVTPTILSAVERADLAMVRGVVEAHSGNSQEAERDLRQSIAISEKEIPKQAAGRVETYVRLVELLQSTKRNQEAAETARRGLEIALAAYGPFATGHPLVAELRAAAGQ
jgi:serine/threonine protein kinase/tetratricopeptide (TPR) repeat protein